MGRTDLTSNGYDAAARDIVRAIVGYVVVITLVSAIALAYGVPSSSVLESVLAVGGILVLAEFVEFLVVRFSLPDAVVPLFGGTVLLAVCIGAILAGESPLLIAFAAFVGGWICNDAVRSFRTTGSG